jgi:hypothetical protein
LRRRPTLPIEISTCGRRDAPPARAAMSKQAAPGVPHGVALYLALVQFLFVTCWTIYVIFLPGLLEAAGLPRRYAIYILMLDQLVFMAMDVAMGVAADRAARILGRVGPFILGATVVSCAAFLLIPYAGTWGTAAPAAMLALIFIWAATSSALRAPPWVLLSRYAAAPTLPWMNALLLTGLAIGGALAPYLGVTLKNVDPRLPFVVSSAALLATVAGVLWVERLLAQRPAVPARPVPAAAALAAGASPFLLGCLLLALGFQAHFSLNSAGQYLRLAGPERLEYLMPVFWIGFNLAMFPGSALTKRHGALPVMAAAALAGAGGMLASALAGSLEVLLAAQLLAGGAWGCILMAGFTAVLGFGRTGREGYALGLLFAALAAATLARLAAVAGGLNQQSALAPALAYGPFVLWCAGAALLAALMRKRPGDPA